MIEQNVPLKRPLQPYNVEALQYLSELLEIETEFSFGAPGRDHRRRGPDGRRRRHRRGGQEDVVQLHHITD